MCAEFLCGRTRRGLRGFFWPRHRYDSDEEATGIAAAIAAALGKDQTPGSVAETG